MISKLRRRRDSRFALIAASLALAPAAAGGAEKVATVAFVMPDAGAVAAAGEIALLKAGLDAIEAMDIGKARRIRDRLPEASIDRHILTWAIAFDGGRDVSSVDIASAALTLPNWPGMKRLRRNSERAFYRENPDAKRVVSVFGDSRPQTLDGIVLLARAHASLGQVKDARAVLAPFWRTAKLEAPEEQRIIKEFGAILLQEDHRARMEGMLYAERVNSADRVAELAGAEPLAKAWTAVIRGAKDAPALLKAVPADMRSAGYYFAEARYLRRKNKFAEAAAIMLKAPTNREALVDPDAWWTERRVLSRELVDHGDMKLAYRIAAAHAAESPVEAADAEFHAGWYALRGLSDAKTAAKHFARIAEIAEGPISLARAYYWLGRAAEAGAPGDARIFYEKAAVYGTAL
jgi:soluble lytic murein transglycosylase